MNNKKGTFTDRSFFNFDGGKRLKEVLVIEASDGDPDYLPTKNQICLLKNYKSNIGRAGRQDPLRDKDVIVLSTDKGNVYFPLDDAREFASYLFSLADNIINKSSVSKKCAGDQEGRAPDEEAK